MLPVLAPSQQCTAASSSSPGSNHQNCLLIALVFALRQPAVYHQPWGVPIAPIFTVYCKGDSIVFLYLLEDTTHWFWPGSDFPLGFENISQGKHHSCQASNMQPPPRKVSDLQIPLCLTRSGALTPPLAPLSGHLCGYSYSRLKTLGIYWREMRLVSHR